MGMIFSCFSIFAQQGGSVNFCNTSLTPIFNGPANRTVTAADSVQAALYWAPAGADPATAVQIGSAVNVGVPLPGIFAGGTRFAGIATPGGTNGQFQVKAWSGPYTNYEAAFSAGGTLLGQSDVFQVTTGNPAGAPPTPPAPLAGNGLNGFVLIMGPPPPPIDIGLRAYDGTTTNKLAAEGGIPTSPVRINKNGTNYGIVLVSTNDPNASNFRIQTSSGTKAFMTLP